MSRELYPKYPVLLVDNEADFLNSLKIKLKQNGINNIECCQDSLKVMPGLKEKKYSLILLDILMPGIKGNELLPKIVEEYPDIAVIMLTASPDNDYISECMKKGATDYLVKPFDDAQLIRMIRSTLNSI